MRAAGWTFELNVLLDNLSVVRDADHLRVGELLPPRIESRRSEKDVEGLPLSGRLARIDARRVAINVLLINPSRVDAAALDSGVSVLVHAIAVVHLDLIAALEIYARVGVFGYAEFDVQLNVAELGIGIPAGIEEHPHNADVMLGGHCQETIQAAKKTLGILVPSWFCKKTRTELKPSDWAQLSSRSMVSRSKVSAWNISNWLMAVLGRKLHPTNQPVFCCQARAVSSDQRWEAASAVPTASGCSAVPNTRTQAAPKNLRTALKSLPDGKDIVSVAESFMDGAWPASDRRTIVFCYDYESPAKFAKPGMKHETALRSAFQELLEHRAHHGSLAEPSPGKRRHTPGFTQRETSVRAFQRPSTLSISAK